MNFKNALNGHIMHCPTVPCPRMINPPTLATVRPGGTAAFKCLAWSFGGLVYEWKRNTSKLKSDALTFFEKWSSPDDASFTSMSYELRLPDTREKHEDYYCCVATNACGNTTSCAWLEVNSKYINT